MEFALTIRRRHRRLDQGDLVRAWTKQEFDAPEPIVPDGCVEIVFNLGDRFINAETGALQPRDLLAGQMTRPVIALPTGDVDLIGVRFKTGRAGAALRIPMWELQDQLIAASRRGPRSRSTADDCATGQQSERLEHLGYALARPRRRRRRRESRSTRRWRSSTHARGSIDRTVATRRNHAPASRTAVSRVRRPARKHVARIARFIPRSTCCTSSPR